MNQCHELRHTNGDGQPTNERTGMSTTGRRMTSVVKRLPGSGVKYENTHNFHTYIHNFYRHTQFSHTYTHAPARTHTQREREN